MNLRENIKISSYTTKSIKDSLEKSTDNHNQLNSIMNKFATELEYE